MHIDIAFVPSDSAAAAVALPATAPLAVRLRLFGMDSSSSSLRAHLFALTARCRFTHSSSYELGDTTASACAARGKHRARAAICWRAFIGKHRGILPVCQIATKSRRLSSVSSAYRIKRTVRCSVLAFFIAMALERTVVVNGAGGALAFAAQPSTSRALVLHVRFRCLYIRTARASAHKRRRRAARGGGTARRVHSLTAVFSPLRVRAALSLICTRVRITAFLLRAFFLMS